jgi:hypothetical protein
VGDAFRKVRTGDALQIPAETFNTFIDAARDFKTRQRSLARDVASDFSQTGIVPVRNDSGEDRYRFDVLGICGPVFPPAVSLTSFQNRVALAGVTPCEVAHLGRFVVLLEPIRAGRIGMACVSGVCVAKVTVEDPTHQFADVEDGNAENLKSAESGSAFLLWTDDPGGDSDGYDGGYGYGYCGYGYTGGYGYGGPVWAVIRIGNIAPGQQWGSV